MMTRKFLKPQVGKSYFLGEYGAIGHCSKEVYGVYFGILNGQHTFMSLNSNSEVEKYVTQGIECLEIWHGEEDSCARRAPEVYLEGIVKDVKEKEFAVKRITESKVKYEKRKLNKEKNYWL